jgi:hypothetical protein
MKGALMDFGVWINAIMDALKLSSHHEAGHIEYARSVNPDVPFDVSIHGDEGEVFIDLDGFEIESKYRVAVAGCLAEGKASGGNGVIDTDAVSINSMAGQIHNGLLGADPAFPVVVPIEGNDVQSSSNKQDFAWLDGAQPNLAALQQAVLDVANFLNLGPNWMRVRRRAWSIMIVKNPGE